VEFCPDFEICKMPCKEVSLPIGALLGILDVVRLLGLTRENKKYIWVPFLDPEGIKILSREAIWKYGKGIGLF
jgi:hypothetical protein